MLGFLVTSSLSCPPSHLCHYPAYRWPFHSPQSNSMNILHIIINFRASNPLLPSKTTTPTQTQFHPAHWFYSGNTASFHHPKSIQTILWLGYHSPRRIAARPGLRASRLVDLQPLVSSGSPHLSMSYQSLHKGLANRIQVVFESG